MKFFREVSAKVFDSISLKYAKKEVERLKPVHEWFISSIQRECGEIVKSNALTVPTRLYLKYQMSPAMAKFSTVYGHLTVIIDPNMKEILRVE